MTLVKTSPMMEQWNSCKMECKDALLLFRLGDFYEAFYEDAKILADILDITLTKRQEVPMAGIPVHTLEQHLDKLMEHKLVVAIAEQIENPKESKGIVQRKVVQILSPATYCPSNKETEARYNYFASISGAGKNIGLSFCDISIGHLSTLEVPSLDLAIAEILKRSPSEILVPPRSPLLPILKEQLSCRFIEREELFDSEQMVASHFLVKNLDGFGLKNMPASVSSLGSLFSYLKEEMHLPLHNVLNIKIEEIGSFLYLDHTTLSHLDIQKGKDQFCLLKLMDRTKTAMGFRLLQNWILHPLISVLDIKKRQEAIKTLQKEGNLNAIGRTLCMIKDLERIATRIQNRKAKPKDLIRYKLSLSVVPELKKLVSWCEEAPLEILEMLSDALDESESTIFKKGFNERLDQFASIKEEAQTFLVDYQNRLRTELDIKTLKVSFTRAFGYYIEVSKGQAHKMPDSFQKKQTLVNADRFISKELAEFEGKILQAEAHSQELEEMLYENLLEVLSSYTKEIFKLASNIAEIDAIYSLAILAEEQNYTCPIIDNSDTLEIVKGRHPMIEKSLPLHFIPNDTYLSSNEKMMIITGPNMAGKSTYIRQVALITIMAQIGSFVPAQKAHIGVIDKLFTRIGASDDLTKGLSTFMVEMSETARILNQKSEKSLIILDEIGRGTSTFDGIAIAEAVATYLIDPLISAPKTLFATHYFELNDLENRFEGIQNYRVAVEETGDDVIFLHKIVKGAADKSYGIHVARLAGLPKAVIDRATQILDGFENKI
jgi:DNA mismatch repair protein MutS